MATHQASTSISIDGRRIGRNEPVYFIAEIGSNFDRNLGRAKELIYLAKEAGAEAAKFQHYTAQSLVSDFGFRQLGGQKSHQASWKKSVFATYEDASLNSEWTQELRDTCRKAGISFFTSPYSFELVDLVDAYVPAYKLGSGDITWIDIVEYMAGKGKPLLMATGASSLEDVKRAADAALSINPDLVLMQCNTNYTAHKDNFSHLMLNVLRTYEECYPGVVLGLSDHMPGHVAVLGAVALGARVVEKHFTDSTAREGPDHPFSMTPDSWREMVDRTRELESALGNGRKEIEANERETVIVQRRSIRAARDLSIGTSLAEGDLTVLRPAPVGGIPPYRLASLMGKRLTRSIRCGEHIEWRDVKGGDAGGD